jgi:pilus assembly protein CpaB
MGQRQIIFLVLAAVVGIGMILLARSLLTPPENPVAVSAEAEPAIPATKVLVANKNIPAGSFLSAGEVEWRSWPADSPTDGLIVQGADEGDYVGAVVRTGIQTGEPVLRARITKPNEGGFLAAVLSPGMRAMTIKVGPTSGIAGLIFPNDRVDVILTQKLGAGGGDEESSAGGDGRRVSETVLESVRVLALDQKTDDLQKEPHVAELATLEVSSKQAEKLALISQMGTLSLVLRSVATEVPVESIAEAATAGIPPLPMTTDSEVSQALIPMAPETLRGHRVQIIRGSEASEVVVPGGR